MFAFSLTNPVAKIFPRLSTSIFNIPVLFAPLLNSAIWVKDKTLFSYLGTVFAMKEKPNDTGGFRLEHCLIRSSSKNSVLFILKT